MTPTARYKAVGALNGPPYRLFGTGQAGDAATQARAMRGFARPSFFRLFDLLLSLTNPGLKRSHWTHDDVEFERERHSVMTPRHGLAIEIFTLKHPGRRSWSLMVTKEYWWAGEESRALKNLRWARPTSGHRGDILSWLRAQEAKLGKLSCDDDGRREATQIGKLEKGGP